MSFDVDTLISSVEEALTHLSAFKRAHEPGSDLHLVADDSCEALYAFLDRLALSLPPAKLASDLT